jgi:hypothetical protein
MGSEEGRCSVRVSFGRNAEDQGSIVWCVFTRLCGTRGLVLCESKEASTIGNWGFIEMNGILHGQSSVKE